MPIGRYSLDVRDKSFKLVYKDIIDLASMDFTLRFNMPGDWTMKISKYSATAAYLTQGNGLILSDAVSGNVIFSGPITTVERTLSDSMMTVSGTDDLVWLKRRQAWPLTGSQTYYQTILSDSPVRWYRLGDLSGQTTAHDFGSDAQNGTYTNSPTLQQNGAIYYDTNAAVLFNSASSQYVSCPSGGALPTGNGTWTVEACIYVTGTPAAQAYICSWGTAATHKMAGIYMFTDGTVRAISFNGDTTGGTALSVNAWHHVVGTWDGTTLKCFVDGAAYGTNATPGNMTINANPPCTVGARADITNYFNGYIGEVAIYRTALSAARITAHYNAFANGTGGGLMQNTGTGFDKQTSVQASTAIYHYVQNNLGSAAQLDRWPGDATNVTRNALTMAADPALGSTLSTAARFDNLLALCQLIAVASSPELGFKLVQTSSGNLTFTIYQPTDRSTTIVLRDVDGSLTDYTYTQDVPTDNFLVVGGSGALAARANQCVFDRSTLAAFGRIEAFQNVSGQSDATTLTTVGNDKLARDLSANAVQTTILPLSAALYGRDYFLGDKITVVMEKNTVVVTDVVREVQGHIDLDNGVWMNPVVGSQDAAQARNEFKDMIRQLKAQGLALGYLEQVQ